MFLLYSIIVSFLFVFIDLIFFKVYQLNNYNLNNYLKNIIVFNYCLGNKTPLKYTKRIKRLIFIDFLLNFSIFLLIFYYLNIIYLYFLILSVILLLEKYKVVFVFILCLPIEILIKNYYLSKAKTKLKSLNVKRIVITGSFGKTSTKNILYNLLKEEFDVCATAESFNTPMGVCRSILEDLKDTDEFFIVEAGARKNGDIKFLADFVDADFGIITPVGKCHLKSFGNIKNIENTKYELCERTKDFVVFNGKSKISKNMYDRFDRKKYLTCLEDGFAYAKNITTNKIGSSFILNIDGKEFDCKTKILGKFNIDNIVVASSMAYILGESLFSIRKGIEKLKPTPHRLELISGEIVNVIDDSYNSNFDGFKEALEILKTFDGEKIVISPGIVELGKMQYQENFEIGIEISKVCDFFIIMNQVNSKALYQGAILGGLNKNNIFFCNTRKSQKEILKKLIKKGDTVLFENDLPDNFK